MGKYGEGICKQNILALQPPKWKCSFNGNHKSKRYVEENFPAQLRFIFMGLTQGEYKVV